VASTSESELEYPELQFQMAGISEVTRMGDTRYDLWSSMAFPIENERRDAEEIQGAICSMDKKSMPRTFSIGN
jgi:hypothetical protein